MGTIFSGVIFITILCIAAIIWFNSNRRKQLLVSGKQYCNELAKNYSSDKISCNCKLWGFHNHEHYPTLILGVPIMTAFTFDIFAKGILGSRDYKSIENTRNYQIHQKSFGTEGIDSLLNVYSFNFYTNDKLFKNSSVIKVMKQLSDYRKEFSISDGFGRIIVISKDGKAGVPIWPASYSEEHPAPGLYWETRFENVDPTRQQAKDERKIQLLLALKEALLFDQEGAR